MRRKSTLLIAIVCIFVIVEILFLRPSTVPRVEEDPQGMFNSIEKLVESQKQKDEVGYTIDGFHYTAVEGEVRHWEMFAKQAVLYEHSRLVLATDAKIKMFDPMGKITNIKGDQAYYKMGNRDLDLQDNVKVVFPDGFWVTTTRAHYSASTELISSDKAFKGETIPQKGELMQVWGTGFNATKSGPDIHILNNTHAKLRRFTSDEITDVNSDKAIINREKKTGQFSMHAQTNKKSFVESIQGTLFVRSKFQDVTYDPQTNNVQYLTATEDVYIKEMDQKRSQTGLKYATCQRADFLTKEDKILLSGFPSAYQGEDILTGDQIIVHRKKNLLEVMQTNAVHRNTQ
ncbi:MAG: LPS export ABC transporter periplasmic protein LptC [Bacteriovoracia bacterium]